MRTVTGRDDTPHGRGKPPPQALSVNWGLIPRRAHKFHSQSRSRYNNQLRPQDLPILNLPFHLPYFRCRRYCHSKDQARYHIHPCHCVSPLR